MIEIADYNNKGGKCVGNSHSPNPMSKLHSRLADQSELQFCNSPLSFFSSLLFSLSLCLCGFGLAFLVFGARETFIHSSWFERERERRRILSWR